MTRRREPPRPPLTGRALAAVVFAGACLGPATGHPEGGRPRPGRPPAPPPAAWVGLVGEYGTGAAPLIVRESDGRLEAVLGDSPPLILTPARGDAFRLAARRGGPPETLVFTRDAAGRATAVAREGASLPRRAWGVDGAGTFRVAPSRPVADLLREARAAPPPREPGPFRPVDLVEVTALEPAIRLDVRYATADNFLATPVYPEARAFLQRPAAEALARAHRRLAPFGHGLLVHDAYRPWSVTRVFWDATPPDKREFVADPADGSRHNRGCAVDLTLYRLDDGEVVEMPGVYDEMSERSYPDFPGGTSEQRWRRELLRWAMEAEGFRVFASEWWHFDHRDWRRYPIVSLPFDRVSGEGGAQ